MVNDTLLKYDSYRNRRKGMREVTKKYGTPGERPCYASVVTEDVTGFGPAYAEQSHVYGHIYVPETQTWLFAEPFKIVTLRHKVGDNFCVGIPVLHIEATYTRVNPDVRGLVAASVEFGLTLDSQGLHKPNLLNKKFSLSYLKRFSLTSRQSTLDTYWRLSYGRQLDIPKVEFGINVGLGL